MSMLKTVQPKSYPDGRTKQSFRDETDINQILKRAQKGGTISHLNKYEGRYGDFGGFDFFDAQLKISMGRTIFDDLPVELRNEFNQSPAAFFQYVNDPANKDRLDELLPALAEPGRQNLIVRPPSADDVSAKAALDQGDGETTKVEKTEVKREELKATGTEEKTPIAPVGVPE